MTRKDFIDLAAALRGLRDELEPHETHIHSRLTEQIADVCARHNPRFDRVKFRLAAGSTTEG